MHVLAAIFGVVAAAPVFAPSLMAFPYHQQIAGHSVHSVVPIAPRLREIVMEADRKVARSPMASSREADQDIFLTDGGWRWKWLAGTSQGAFAVNRAVNDAIIVNRASIPNDLAVRSAAIGGKRRLSGVLAHEMTHSVIRSHFGVLADVRYPADLREGYCDFVAGEGSLSDGEALSLLQKGTDHPALPYWKGRKRVEVELTKGVTVDRLFSTWTKQNPL